VNNELSRVGNDSPARLQAIRLEIGARLALFAADLGYMRPNYWQISEPSVADQLYRSVGAISAAVAEGYSRGTGRNRARFYEYGLGSAREARGWCFKGRHVLGTEFTHHRRQLLTHIVGLLLTMIPDQRGQALREDSPPYDAAGEPPVLETTTNLAELLEIVPMP
jgi:four helix bundle protein